MPNQITMYKCNKCHTVYKSYDSALKCETVPVEPSMYNIGAVISFENEETMFGSRYSYYTETGTILYKYLVLATQHHAPIHKWVYVVLVPKQNNEMEVVMATDDFGLSRLISLAEKKFQLGYANSLQNTRG